MPSCRRCGGTLAAADFGASNWSSLGKKDFYSCPHCGGMWLYSSSLNCPVLIDPKNIIDKGPRRPRASRAGSVSSRRGKVAPKGSISR